MLRHIVSNHPVGICHNGKGETPVSNRDDAMHRDAKWGWTKAYMQNRLTNSQRYLVVGLVGLVRLGLPLRVSRVSAMVSARFSVHEVSL